ncbi:MAG: ABC transporter permease [Vicinamibacterales bacterium]
MTRGLTRTVQALLLGLMVGAWEMGVRAGWIDPFLFSQPTAVGQQIVAWVADGSIVRHMWVTLVETSLGFLLGAGLGIALGMLLAFVPALAAIVGPWLVLMNALPRIVLAPMFVLWFGLGMLSKVVMAASLVFFVVFFATFTGLTQVDRDILNNARLLGATRVDLVRHVYLPSAFVWISSSLRTSVGFALMGAVVGEYLGASEGMGWLIYLEESMFRSAGVMAGLTVLLALVAVVDAGMTRLERRFSLWRV